jgi:hypothetical protein
MWYTTSGGPTRRNATAVTWILALTLLSGRGRDPEFMTFDAAARRVDLTLIAGFDQSNSGYNFNGAPDGTHRLTVPVGWQIRIAFANRDVFPHSVIVFRQAKVLPLRIARPAFPGAATRSFQQGLPPGAREDIAFVAAVPGDYLIGCGCPTHVVLGMYVRLRVSADATVPTYERVPRGADLRIE